MGQQKMMQVSYDQAQVEAFLDYSGCITAMRDAMRHLSCGSDSQPLRQILKVANNGLFGVMPGDLTDSMVFGAKLVSVFDNTEEAGRTRHQGVVVVFESVTGSVLCFADAESVTRIRTACASAAATDALARKDSKILSIFGTGVQAESHIRALSLVRPFEEILVWGRSAEKATDLASRLSKELGLKITPEREGYIAAERADVICTVSGSKAPILYGAWVKSGTHINLVGSSFLGPVEVDTDVVVKSRYFADYLPSVIAQGSELAVAREAGVIEDSHIVADIGEVYAGTHTGRENAEQITLYKSLGHVVQDLAATLYLHNKMREEKTTL